MDTKRKIGGVIQKEIFQKNADTGETELITQEFTQFTKRENFIQAYVEGISRLLRVDSKTDIRVIISLWLVAEWNTNRIILVKAIKEEIARKLGYSNYKQIDNSVRRLVEMDILVKGGRSEYYMNPDYFFRGSSMERIKAVQFILNLQIKD